MANRTIKNNYLLLIDKDTLTESSKISRTDSLSSTTHALIIEQAFFSQESNSGSISAQEIGPLSAKTLLDIPSFLMRCKAKSLTLRFHKIAESRSVAHKITRCFQRKFAGRFLIAVNRAEREENEVRSRSENTTITKVASVARAGAVDAGDEVRESAEDEFESEDTEASAVLAVQPVIVKEKVFVSTVRCLVHDETSKNINVLPV